jgi:peptide/nickel transport system permease protein
MRLRRPLSDRPLLRYVLRRIGIGVLLLLVVSVVVFAATQILPGDAAKAILGRLATPGAVRQLRRELGLDRSPVRQYWSWLSGLLHGNFGTSLANREPVWTYIGPRLVNSIVLAVATLAVLLPIAVGLGVYAGVRNGSVVDHAISQLTLSMIVLPEFVTGILLALVIGVTLSLLPPVSLLAPGQEPWSDPRLLVLPILTLLISGTAYVTRMVRAGVVEVMRTDYVQAARLNGMPERRLVIRHVLRNSMAPAVQVIALTVQWLVGGIVVVETVFQYPGIGAGLATAVQLRDIPVVQSVSILIAAFYIVVNIAADISIVLLVPKLRTTVR